MVWLIVVAALVVLGLAAWAGTGRFGAMPGPVNDSPRPVIPPGPVNRAFLDGLQLPLAAHGYDVAEVQDYLQAHVAGEATLAPAEVTFGVVRRGYSMPAVDAVLARVTSEWLSPGFRERHTQSEEESPDADVPAGEAVEEAVDAVGEGPRRAVT